MLLLLQLLLLFSLQSQLLLRLCSSWRYRPGHHRVSVFVTGCCRLETLEVADSTLIGIEGRLEGGSHRSTALLVLLVADDIGPDLVECVSTFHFFSYGCQVYRLLLDRLLSEYIQLSPLAHLRHGLRRLFEKVESLSLLFYNRHQ